MALPDLRAEMEGKWAFVVGVKEEVAKIVDCGLTRYDEGR